MLDIKELTMEHHKDAERQCFVKILMSGEIDHKLYATYLYNQAQCYSVLEKYGLHNSLFRDTPNLLRTEHILYDFNSFGIETPESRTRDKEEKKYGLLSKYFLKAELSLGKKITVKTYKGDETGKFGRILGDIWIDGK